MRTSAIRADSWHHHGRGSVNVLDEDEGVVHVTRVSVADAPLSEFFESLSGDERERAVRFAHEKDRHRFIVVRGWLRRLLGGYLQRSPAEIRLEYGSQGKPALPARDNERDIHFNVSHSAEVGVLAFSRGREVGIDVELLDPRFDVQGLSSRWFSPLEHEAMQSSPADGRLRRFFQLWTAKEAYIKARGGGLSIPLQDFSIHLCEDRDTWSVESTGNVRAPLFVRRLEIAGNYAAAIAAMGDEWSVRLFEAWSTSR